MDRVARRFEQALRFFTRLEDTFLVSLLSFMIGLAFLQIVLRDFFSTGLLWADPLLKNLVIWVGLVGASIATREDKHITIDVIPRVLPEPARLVVCVATSLFSAFICFVLLHASLKFLGDEFEAHTVYFSGIPAWPFQMIFPVSFFVMGVRFGARSLKYLVATVKQDSK